MNAGQLITTQYGATITKIQDAQPVGEYKPTDIDQIKKDVDFRLINVNPYVISWEGGGNQKVTKRELTKLQSKHTWATDF